MRPSGKKRVDSRARIFGIVDYRRKERPLGTIIKRIVTQGSCLADTLKSCLPPAKGEGEGGFKLPGAPFMGDEEKEGGGTSILTFIVQEKFAHCHPCAISAAGRGSCDKKKQLR